MRELFVYYRVDARDAAQTRAIVLGWQRELRAAHAPLIARLLKRPVAGPAGDDTWMETYALAPGAADFDEALLAALSAGPAALAPLVMGPRRVEVFVACAS